MNDFTKSELKDGRVVKYRNGSCRGVEDGHLMDYNEQCFSLDSYNDDLTYLGCPDFDIVEVFEPIWQRIPKMTHADLVAERGDEFEYVKTVCEKKRKAEVGERIRIVAFNMNHTPSVALGDEFTVSHVQKTKEAVGCKESHNSFEPSEYVVLVEK